MLRVTTTPKASNCVLQEYTKTCQANTATRKKIAYLGLAILLGALALTGLIARTNAENMHDGFIKSKPTMSDQFPSLFKGRGVKLGVRG